MPHTRQIAELEAEVKKLHKICSALGYAISTLAWHIQEIHGLDYELTGLRRTMQKLIEEEDRNGKEAEASD